MRGWIAGDRCDSRGDAGGRWHAWAPERWTTQYSLRTTDAAAFTKFATDHEWTVPATFLGVIDPPTYETLDAMITRLGALYTGQNLPSANP
jgi:hypothetical protein